MHETSTFEIRGRVSAGAMKLDFESCRAYPPEAQVSDVGALVRGKEGRALRLSAILARMRPAREAHFANILSADPSFAISVPLAEIAERAVVVYASAAGDAPLGGKQGGPFRLLVPGHPDECVNVKQLAAIELAETRGRDTRPLDDAEHAKLHAKKKA